MNSSPDINQQPEEQPRPNQESDGRVVARNFSTLMVSQLISWGLAIASTIVIPRYLGAEVMGRLHVSSSLWRIGVVFSGFGMDLLVAKEIAREPARTREMVASTTSIRVAMLVPASAVLFGYTLLAGYSDQTLGIMAILGVYGLLNTVKAGLTAALQGLERMHVISIATIAERVVIVGGGIGLLLAGYGVYTVASAVAAGTALSLVIHAWALRRHRWEDGGQGRYELNTRSMRAMLRASAPYFGVGFFAVLYRQLDAVVISAVVENDEVLGWYGVYDRFAGTLLFVPTVLITAVYPTLSRLHADETRDSSELTQRGFRLMLLISVPLGFGLAAIAEPFIVLLVGEDFRNAGPVMAVGGVVLSLTYLNMVFGTFLVSMDLQRAWNRVLMAGALLTVPLDLALVPFFQQHFDNGAIGGAVAYLVTESVILTSAIVLLPRGSLPSSSVAYASRVVIAGLVMVGAILPFRETALPVPIAIGAVTYMVMLVVLRAVAAEDRALLASAVRSRSAHRQGSKNT